MKKYILIVAAFLMGGILASGYSKIKAPQQTEPAYAAGEPLTIGAPVTLSGTNTITARKFIDSSNSMYLFDPASTDKSLILAGKVGIGTTNPAEKLEVVGNIKLSGASPTYTLTNVIAPVATSDVATKAYVDAAGASGAVLVTYAWAWATSVPAAGTGTTACPTGWTEVYKGYSSERTSDCWTGTAFVDYGQAAARDTGESGTYMAPGPTYYMLGGVNPGAYVYSIKTCRVCVK